MFIYTMCGSYFAISTLKKVSERHFTCRFYLSTIAPALRYLKTLSPDGMPISPAVRYRFAVPVLPTRTSHLLSLLPHVCPPRRLPPRFSRRFPVFPSVRRPFRFLVVRNTIRERFTQYRACDAVPVRPSSCHPIEHAHAYRLQSLYRPTPPTSPLHPCRLPVPILRRPDRLVVWLRDWRGGRA